MQTLGWALCMSKTQVYKLRGVRNVTSLFFFSLKLNVISSIKSHLLDVRNLISVNLVFSCLPPLGFYLSSGSGEVSSAEMLAGLNCTWSLSSASLLSGNRHSLMKVLLQLLLLPILKAALAMPLFASSLTCGTYRKCDKSLIWCWGYRTSQTWRDPHLPSRSCRYMQCFYCSLASGVTGSE